MSWVEKVEFCSDRILFKVVGAIFSWMLVLQLRIKVIYKRLLFWRTRAYCLVIPDSVNILLGRRECILNKQLGMEVYVNLRIGLEWTFATSKNFTVRNLIFSYCSICKYVFFLMVELMCDFTDELIVICRTDFLRIYRVLFLILFQPAQPRLAHVVSGKVEPIMLAPVPYEFIA
jgi:hypothetical protein